MKARWFVSVGCVWASVFVSGCAREESARLASRRALGVRAPAIGNVEPRFAAEMADIEDVSDREFDTETYDRIVENPFLSADRYPLSTFAIDVDTASYAIVRRFLNQRRLPPPGAVRIEELVNYFTYGYPQPAGAAPFSVNVEVAGCPWASEHRLVRIGLKGEEVELRDRPSSNLVFLLDVSGSMDDSNKLPMVESAMKMLVDRLGENDRVAIAVYAGASGLALPSTKCDDKPVILSALDRLAASGSTNGGEGIRLAYAVAEDNFIQGGVNRVILCTDGDFNVGITNQSALIRLIEEKARGGVFLSVLGFGMGNYKDSTMEKLADKGNGNYAYLDTLNEARKVLVEEMTGTLVTIAKDVKIQIDFNPARVSGYRLIGYENRLLRAEDFKDDSKDAGEIGAGHTVTAFYEIIPAGQAVPGAGVDGSKYRKPVELTEAAGGAESLTVRLRYKDPDGQKSRPLEVGVIDEAKPFDAASEDFRFAASVAQFGMLLRSSQHSGAATFERVLESAAASLGPDSAGYRAEFVELVNAARGLKR